MESLLLCYPKNNQVTGLSIIRLSFNMYVNCSFCQRTTFLLDVSVVVRYLAFSHLCLIFIFLRILLHRQHFKKKKKKSVNWSRAPGWRPTLKTFKRASLVTLNVRFNTHVLSPQTQSWFRSHSSAAARFSASHQLRKISAKYARHGHNIHSLQQTAAAFPNSNLKQTNSRRTGPTASANQPGPASI